MMIKNIAMNKIYSRSGQSNFFFSWHIFLCCTKEEYINISYTFYKIFFSAHLWKLLHYLCLVVSKVCFLADYWSKTNLLNVVFNILNFPKLKIAFITVMPRCILIHNHLANIYNFFIETLLLLPSAICHQLWVFSLCSFILT